MCRHRRGSLVAGAERPSERGSSELSCFIPTLRTEPGGRLPSRLRSRLVDERYGMVLVPLTEANQSADHIVAERQGDGWKLVSKRMDKYGAAVIVFSRPG